MDANAWVDVGRLLAQGGGSNVVLVFLVISIITGWLVPRGVVDDLRKQRDDLQERLDRSERINDRSVQLSDRSTGVAEQAASLAVEIIQRQEERERGRGLRLGSGGPGGFGGFGGNSHRDASREATREEE